MSTEPCGAMNRDGSRCLEPPAPESRFCQYHGRNGGPSPLLIWRAPREETAAASPSPGGVPTAAPPSPLAAPTLAPSEERAGEPADGPPAEGLDWFLGLLQQAMTEMMASESSAPQKASAVARLGNLYLKAHRTAELAQQNKELRQHVAALAERLAAAEAEIAALAERPAVPVNPAVSSADIPETTSEHRTPGDRGHGNKDTKSACADSGVRDGGLGCASQRPSLAGSNPARRTCARA